MILSINTKYVFALVVLCLLFSFFYLPIPTHAAGTMSGIIFECDPVKKTVGTQEFIIYGECTFDDLVKAVTSAVDKIVEIALGFSVVVIAWAGYLFMVSGDKPGERTKARGMLWKVVEGIFFIIAASLIVHLIASTLLNESVVKVT